MVHFHPWHYLVIPALIVLHLILSPYTKVEESFNIQAIHDILEYGIPTSNVHYKFKALFDHMTFSGAVPRTFVGALITSAFARPFIWIGAFDGLTKQSIARGVLGFANAAAFVTYTRAVKKAYGGQTALWYTVLQASQFHVIYYASRTLPNTFAFCLSTFALAANLPDPLSSLGATKRNRLSLYLLTLATVIFRSEVALLLASQAGYHLLKTRGIDNQISFIRYTVLPAVLSASIVGLILTIGIDTYFWQSPKWLWPEATAFLLNVLPKDGRAGASAWGTSPWHWYLTSAIPRLMLSPTLLLIPWGVLFTTQQSAILDNIIPVFSYIAVYSILPHKETRFLFPIVPPLTLAAALATSYLNNRRQLIAQWLTIGVTISTAAAATISHVFMLPLSAQGYPGGHALQSLHTYHNTLSQENQSNLQSIQPQVRVHLTNLALQTGVTLFLEQPPLPTNQTHTSKEATETLQPIILPGSPDGSKPALTLHPKPSGAAASIINGKHNAGLRKSPLWIYDKSSSETEFLTPSFWNQFDYVVVEDPARVIGAWEIVGECKALRRTRPRLLRADERRGPLVLGGGGGGGGNAEDDGIYHLLDAMYGQRTAWLYAIFHDVFREGYGLGRSLTGGVWLDWGAETRLYILKATESGINPE